ncbi:MAG: hypothetical protein LH617_02285, partial [Ramlibacter sp.]|nr:hypothetical protein [Ramlibacter sp.]
FFDVISIESTTAHQAMTEASASSRNASGTACSSRLRTLSCSPRQCQVEAALARLREHLFSLLPDVVVDALAQHGHLRVIQSGFRFHRQDLRDQLLGAGMLDLGLVEEVIVAQRLTHWRRENLFASRDFFAMLVLP